MGFFTEDEGLISESTAIITGFITTLLAVVMSALLISRHRAAWVNPHQQTLIIYIILMVPLFSVDSLIGLIDIEASDAVVTILDGIKEVYESFVIASFLSLMFSYVGVSPDTSVVPPSVEKKHLHIPAPYSWFVGHDKKCDKHTIHMLTTWTKQFVYIRPVISIIQTIMELIYDKPYEAGFGWLLSWAFTIILNISVTTAVYALMLFYHAFADEMAAHRPLAKFLCIKGVVFFAFWQGVIIQLLVHFGILLSGHFYKVEEIEEAIQNLLVCIEMGLIFTFCHNYAFDPSLYAKEKKAAKAE